MKTKKIVALLLSTTMLLGCVAGCSKVKKVDEKSMEKAADKVEVDVEEISDIDDLEDFDSDDLEDGILFTIDPDMIEDVMEEEHMDEDDIEEAIDMINDMMDAEIEFEIDDIEEISVYAQVDGDNVAVVVYANLGDSNLASEAFRIMADSTEDINDELEDLADDADYDLDGYEFNLKKLSGKEYYNGKNSGYIKLCLTPDDIQDIIENEFKDAVEKADLDIDEDDIDDMADEIIDEIPYDIMAGGVYYNGGSLVVTFIASDDDDMIDQYDKFMKSIGLASPTDVKPSKYFKQTVANGIVMYASMMMNSYSKYADIDYNDFDF